MIPAFRRPDRDEWLDAGGRRVSLARAGLGRAITPIARDGETIGAIVHHRGLTEERDLHDGAQPRLVALSLQVNLAADKLHDDPATAATLLDRARDGLRHALEELCELARGIHPAILTDHGLVAALDGHLNIRSEPGEGTIVRAETPCASS